MHIGLTYDLRSEYLAMGYSLEQTAEFDKEETIDRLVAAMVEGGHVVERIGNARALAGRLVAGDRWELVFNICEGLHGLSRETQVPALLELYEIPYVFSDALVTSVCLHKGIAKAVLREAGLATPRYRAVSRRDEADGKAADGRPLNFPVFAKPIAEGTGKGVTLASKVNDRATLWETCSSLISQFSQPALVEEFLPGREFTVGITGTGPSASVLGTLEIVLLESAEPGIYSYLNKEEYERRVAYRFVKPDDDWQAAAAERLALAAWRVLGCRDAGRIDIRCDANGHPQFLEVNPLAGLHPVHSDLPMIAAAAGWSYSALIHRIVVSASERTADRC